MTGRWLMKTVSTLAVLGLGIQPATANVAHSGPQGPEGARGGITTTCVSGSGDTAYAWYMGNGTRELLTFEYLTFVDGEPVGFRPTHAVDPGGVGSISGADGEGYDQDVRLELWVQGAAEPLDVVEYNTRDCTDGDRLVERIGGSNRWETAELIADELRPYASGQAYIASGETFADALSASAAAAAGRRWDNHHWSPAPLLLVKSGSVPAATQRALDSASLDSITLVGGPKAVNETVRTGLEATAPVTRIAGADRYGTAVALMDAKTEWVNGAHFLASGENFPDALSAAAYAARPLSTSGIRSSHAKPILLTKADALPPVTEEALRRVELPVDVFGGEAAISKDQYDYLYWNVVRSFLQRIAGADRYATSAVISARFPSNSLIAVIASGEDFPDALAGASLAAAWGGPLLLTRKGSVPPVVLEELDRLSPERVVILGGTGAVSQNVEDQLNLRISDWTG